MKEEISYEINATKKNSRVRRIKQNRLMLLKICAICTMQKSRYFKNKDGS